MFDTDQDKFLYLVGCALNGTAAVPADITKITKQAYGIAEEMLILINKLKETADCVPSIGVHAVSREKLESGGSQAARAGKDSKDFKDSKDTGDCTDFPDSPDSPDSTDSKPRHAKEITGELPAKAPEPVKPLKTPALPAFINKAANLHAGASAAARDVLALKEPVKLDDLSSHDKGWNYTPWGKS
jgi:hypothetical protein